MNTPPVDTWPILTSQYTRVVSANDQEPAHNEREFRNAVDVLCNQHRERDKQRHLVRFRRQHEPIILFARSIDATNSFAQQHSLQAVVWQLLKRGIAIALDSSMRLSDFTTETAHLNNNFPRLQYEYLTRFPNDLNVQKALQRLFREYLDCYLSMFTALETVPIRLSLNSYRDRVQSVAESCSSYVKQLEDALNAAEAEEKRQLAAVPRSPSSMASVSEPVSSSQASAHFEHVEPKGNGSYGEVSIVKETTFGTLYVQKVIRVRDDADASEVEAVARQVGSEVEIMHKLSHHHIAGVKLHTRNGPTFRLYLLPVADCDLREYLRICASHNFPREEIRHIDNWFGCLISALAFAHGEGIKHHDVKPSNILIHNHRAYLSDFGSAVDVSKLERSVTPDQSFAGTPTYWPPEGRHQAGRSADTFALGCVFSEMLTVRQGRSLRDYQNARYRSDTDYGYAFRHNLKGVKTWLCSLPGMDNSDSPHTWLLLDALLKMLEEDPQRRIEPKKMKRALFQEMDTFFCSTCS